MIRFSGSVLSIFCLLQLILFLQVATARRFPRVPGVPYDFDYDADSSSSCGWGREMTLFATTEEVEGESSSYTAKKNNKGIRVEQQMRAGSSSFSRDSNTDGFASFPFREGRSSPYSSSYTNPRSSIPKRSLLQPLTDWWSTNIHPNVKSWPKIVCRVEPTTTLKLRKTFRPLGTIIRLGANFNTQLQVWQFKSDWEDAIIGGKLTLAGRELQLTKSWQLSVGAVEDLVTRLRFRAAVDLSTWKAYARVGFRTERLTPINIMEGFTFQKEVPLDGPSGHVKLQVKANFALPEPEIEYSTETQRSLIGMGDIQVSIEELNLLLDY